MTTVAVVTVVLDDRPGLELTAASVASQTSQVEWIVVDGGSRGAHAIDPSALRTTPSSFTSEPDAGIYDAMNKGWRRAKSEWVIFVNAGDALCQPQTIHDVVQRLAQTTADWAFGLVRNIDADSTVIGVQNASPFNRRGHALGNTTVPHQATFMRRSLLDRLGGFRLDYGTAADQELIYRAALTGPPEELVWPITDFAIGGRGMQVPPTRIITAMRRARREQGDLFLGNPVSDVAATGVLLVSRGARPFLERLQREPTRPAK